jgi:hypothetical protein
MFINGIQMMGDQGLVGLLEFIGSRLEEIGNGKEVNGIRVDAGSHLETGSEEQDEWDEGYLTALNDIVVFIQGLHSRAAA